MTDFATTMSVLSKNRDRRSYPQKGDKRERGGVLFPIIRPKFKLSFDNSLRVFTIGSCFARNIEEALAPLGVTLPTQKFTVPKSEWPTRPNGLLNEYNPGTMSQRVLAAIGRVEDDPRTIVGSGDSYIDLLLPNGAADVTLERALQRRREVGAIYTELPTADLVILTLGFIEEWFDTSVGLYLNRMPPMPVARASPGRFVFRRLDVSESLALLDPAVRILLNSGKKVIITVSPVPISTTISGEDCVTANEYSKATLRVCAETMRRKDRNVDYFPSYEIVRSAGLAVYEDDNMHVRSSIVSDITAYMVSCYSSTDSEELVEPH